MDTLTSLIEALIAIGEDRDELEFWKSIYPTLEKEDQEALLENLRQELKELEKVS